MQDYSLISVARTLHAWRKPLFFTVGGALVLSSIIALLLPVYYRSSTVFYAASQDLFKPQKVFGYSQGDMYYYGGSEDIDRLISAATSHEVLDHLVDSFNLYSHYGIKAGTEKAAYRVREKLTNLYQITRTKQDALEISVEDKEREYAAHIANAAREKINDVITGVIKSSQRDLVSSYMIAIQSKEVALGAIEDSLRKMQDRYGIYDAKSQSEYLSTLITTVEAKLVRERGMLKSYRDNPSARGARDSIAHLTARIAGLEGQKEFLTGKDTSAQNVYNFRTFGEGKGRVELYDDAYKKAVNALNVDREIVKQMEAAVALDVTAIHLIEEAAVPVVKARPKRMFFVLACTLAVFLFAVFGILLFESIRHQDWSFLKF